MNAPAHQRFTPSPGSAIATFAPTDLARVAESYPDHSTVFHHALCNHPLLSIGSLAALAKRMNPAHVEVRKGNVPVDMPDGGAPHTGSGPVSTLHNIETAQSWIMFRWAQNDPIYKALLDELLNELEDIVRPATGAMLKHEAFIFVSSPYCITPFHFDPEHNVLLQIAGEKLFSIFPPADPATAPATAHEAFHTQGANMLHWHGSMAERGVTHTMRPGDALYVPVKSPHHVRVGSEPSISLSVTWRSHWSEQEADACTFNAFLRSKGVAPKPTRQWPHGNAGKATAWRIMRKVCRNH
ncbi:MAG: cupin-like domain-containing protein [Novosphingobium sp.]